jgi:hypothetical protein
VLAGFFVLAALVCLNRYVTKKRPAWYAAMIGCAVFAVLSKEAAYALPLVAAGMLPFKPQSSRRDILRAVGGLLVACGIVFLYRFLVIGGVGGYRTTGGESAVLQFSAVHLLKALLFRQWSFLFFPINWSSDLNVWLEAAVVLMLLVMLGFVVWSKASCRLLLAAMALILLSELPVQHLLLMTKDLAGGRVLYLPLLGLALFWGVLVEGCKEKQIGVTLAAGLLVFQFVAVCHNLMIWRQVAFLSQQTCQALGTELTRDPRPVIVRGLPMTWHGVFFLRNGFADCVHINSPGNGSQIYVEGEEHPILREPRVFSWNNTTQRLQELTSPNHE